jgi:hypothetical protein
VKCQLSALLAAARTVVQTHVINVLPGEPLKMRGGPGTLLAQAAGSWEPFLSEPIGPFRAHSCEELKPG